MPDKLSHFDIRFFDRNDDFAVSFGHLPHWSQVGTLAFMTWRTADSMPRPVVNRWVLERNAYLFKLGLKPHDNWRAQLEALPKQNGLRIKWELIQKFDRHLDACHGACVLRQPRIAKIVADSLRKFDGDRYVLTDFVVMPNHVHVLAAFRTLKGMRNQISAWKRFQARQINQALKQEGHFWQTEDFDHLVRSEEQFLRYRRYIAENPLQAGLKPGEALHWQR